jgi:hypothetical protein
VRNQQSGSLRSGDGTRLLCVPAGWETYISGEFYELQQILVGYGWTKQVIDEAEDAAIVAAIGRAQVVILWEAYELLERNDYALCRYLPPAEARAKRIFFCDDVHYFTPERREQRLRGFEWADLILATYPHKLREWYPEVAERKICWTPHAAASYFHSPARLSPTSDRVLLSGSRTWPYPFRQFCQVKLPASVIDVVDHPGYPGYPGHKATAMEADPSALHRLGREGYATLLRQYPAMLVCGSIFGYLVAKVFEGMASGCLTICERSSLGERLSALGFIEGEHYVGTDLQTVIGDTVAVRDAFLRDDSKMRNMIAAAAQKVSVAHTTAVRAAQIHDIATAVFQDKVPRGEEACAADITSGVVAINPD